MSDLKLTSYSEGFGIFNKVYEEEFDVVSRNGDILAITAQISKRRTLNRL